MQKARAASSAGIIIRSYLIQSFVIGIPLSKMLISRTWNTVDIREKKKVIMGSVVILSEKK